MPFLIPAVAAGATIYGIVVGGTVIGLTLAGWAALAFAAASTAFTLLSRPKKQSFGTSPVDVQTSIANNGHLLNSRSPDTVIKVIYGQCRVGGNQVFIHAAGDKHQYLNMALTWGEGPIEGIAQDSRGDLIYFDDERIQDAEYYKGEMLVLWNNYPGTYGQQNDWLLSDATYGLSTWADPMRWTAYSAFRLIYNAEAWDQLPDITAVIKGRKLYDPRTGTVGYGTGSTPKGRNPALVWYDFMTNQRYGMGIPYSMINEQSVIDAANWCDTGQDSIPYVFDGVVMERKAFSEVIQDILNSFRGYMVWSAGQYYLKTFAYDSAVMSLTESDIDSLPDRFQITMPGTPETPNRCKVVFADGDEDYVGKHVTVQNSTDFTSDGEIREIELPLIGVNEYTLALHLATFHLKRQRYNKTFTFTCHPRTIALDPGDMVQVTHTFPGWTNQVLRVLSSAVTPDHKVAITFQEEDSSIYDMTGVEVASHTYYNCTIPSPIRALTDPTGLAAETTFDETTENKLDAMITFSCDHMGSGINYLFRYKKRGTTDAWTKVTVEDPQGEIMDLVSSTTGTLSMDVEGDFTGDATTYYKIQIDGVGTPNTFRWSDNNGSSWRAKYVAITGSNQDLNNGVSIIFSDNSRQPPNHIDNHGAAINDYWTFTGYVQSTVKVRARGLPMNTRYAWGVRCWNDTGRTSDVIAGDSITTWAPPLPSMADYYPSITYVKQGRQVIINWSDWDDFGEYFVKGYKILYMIGSAGKTKDQYTTFAEVDAKTSQFKVVGLSPGLTYDFRVCPVGWTGDGIMSDLPEVTPDNCTMQMGVIKSCLRDIEIDNCVMSQGASSGRVSNLFITSW